MAGLHRSGYGVFRLTIRFAGKRIVRSLATRDEATALQVKHTVERTLRLVEDGHLEAPQRLTQEELWQFLKAGGKVRIKPSLVEDMSLQAVCAKYLDSFATGAKEQSTLTTERHHINHYLRYFGNSTRLRSITDEQITGYIKSRRSEKGKYDRPISHVTICKELQTFASIWSYASKKGWVEGISPLENVHRPRGSEKPPFMTLEEVEQRLSRGGLNEGQVAELWECLYLRESEVADFLDHARKASEASQRFSFIYPALAFCAYTGARRSEMFRCLIDDVAQTVLLREKKKSQRQEFTFRQVPIHPELGEILDGWLSVHPGGQFMFCKRGCQALDDKTSREAFDAVTRRGPWSFLRGYHILRHSFASNLARHGVDQRQIDAFMGHQTEASRRRYRHLFPEDAESAVTALSFATGPRVSPGQFRIVG